MSQPAKQSSGTLRPPISIKPIEDVEPFYMYDHDGYHPLNIGSPIGDRYRVVDKLGHGSYSTVWLARDKQLQRLVTVKVCTGEESRRESESKMLSLLAAIPLEADGDPALGRDMMPSLLDTFQVQGPNGTHTCLVTAAASGSLSRSKRNSVSAPLDLHVARAIAAQLVLAVAYLHGNGIIHGGEPKSQVGDACVRQKLTQADVDLHLGNILLKASRGFELLSDEELRERWGEPEEEQVETDDDKPVLDAVGIPSLATLPAFFGKNSDELSLSDAAILLADFGTSFCPSQETRFTFPTSPHCRPPEDRFEPEQPRSFPSEIWTLACSIWAVIGQRSLFETYFCSNDRTTAQQVEALGRLPPEWWARWENRSKYFTEDGQLLRNRRVASLDAEFDSAIQNGRKELGQEMVSVDEKGAFMTMIRPMLEYRPEKRCTVNEVLQSEWMTKWAMPDFKRMRKELAAKKEV